MLDRAAGLSPRALQAIAELERRVIDADGGRLKLEWGALRSRTGDRVEDLLWWEDDRLLGFLGLYSFGSALELAGMVDPGARRRGIGTALLDAAVPIWHERGAEQVLLIVPRSSAAGQRLARRRGAALDHSEHALVLSRRPTGGEPKDSLSLRQAGITDVPVVVRLLELGFGEPAGDVADRLASRRDRTLVVELSGSPVGTLRVTRHGNDAGIYAFVIDPAWQGRGIGRDALRRVCQQSLDEGAGQIHLEVAVENDRALRLYTSIGFIPVATEDYYALPAG
ncbi:MAG: GNAT family N-acetyltransferase [Solirubrobacterales bacterium]|nr:GNAT family N-acetyltransferase [Solirubrobacterales bacterium]